MRRFILHSLWVVLPFCALLAITWNAWRSDAETRKNRILESANQLAARVLNDIDANLGPWSPIPETDRTGIPPLPDNDPKAVEALKRYQAGDYEGVLGSPESLRSPAGLPLRSLASLQLLRKETDPVRLAELASVLTDSMDFVTPFFLEEAENRFEELNITPPSALADWRGRWQLTQAESSLLHGLDSTRPATWKENDGVDFLVELNSLSRQWRVSKADDVRAEAEEALKIPTLNLADGLAIRLSVAGKTVAGRDGLTSFSTKELRGWKAEVVLLDAAAYERSETRTRNFITAVISVAGIAALFGLIQSGRAYPRSIRILRRGANDRLDIIRKWTDFDASTLPTDWPALEWGDIVEVRNSSGGRSGAPTTGDFAAMIPARSVTFRLGGLEFPEKIPGDGSFWLASQTLLSWFPNNIHKLADLNRFVIHRKGLPEPITLDFSKPTHTRFRLLDGDTVEVSWDIPKLYQRFNDDQLNNILWLDKAGAGVAFRDRSFVDFLSRQSDTGPVDFSKICILRRAENWKLEMVDFKAWLEQLPPREQWVREELVKSAPKLNPGDAVILIDSDAAEAEKTAAEVRRKGMEVSGAMMPPRPSLIPPHPSVIPSPRRQGSSPGR